MRALIKTKKTLYTSTIVIGYTGRIEELDGLFLVPVEGDTYFVPMSVKAAESCITELFSSGVLDLTAHVAMFMGEDYGLYEDDFDFDFDVDC